MTNSLMISEKGQSKEEKYGGECKGKLFCVNMYMHISGQKGN